jgi:hypothetical protein
MEREKAKEKGKEKRLRKEDVQEEREGYNRVQLTQAVWPHNHLTPLTFCG